MRIQENLQRFRKYTDLKKENRSLADEYSDLYKQRIN
jgi:hypothetical protein